MIIIVSDGSVKDNNAAAAWILTTELLYSEGTYIYGREKVPGKFLDSHRAESFGIFGGLLLLLTRASTWGIDHANRLICV
jgi:hypothetical protein